MSDTRSWCRPPRGRLARVLAAAFACIGHTPLTLLALGAAESTSDAHGKMAVLESPGPWNETPIAPGKSNYRLVLEYSATTGTNAMVSLQGWKRLLPAGENQRAEFAIEDADASPFIIRHWRAGRDRPDSTDRPRPPDPGRGPDVNFTAPDGFQLHRAFIQPLRDTDHGELWETVTAADASVGAALYRDHCRACHGDGDSPGQYPEMSAWTDRDASLSSSPHALWRAFNDAGGSSAGHPRLTDLEAYHVVRYLRESLLAPVPDPAADDSADMPRGRVLATPVENPVSSASPWRRMDHGPFLFQPLRLADPGGKTQMEVEHALVIRLDPGIGGVTRGRVRAIYDVGSFRFLGIARGGDFADESAIFDGNGPPGLTLQGSDFEKGDDPGEAGIVAEFKALAVSGREARVIFTIEGNDFIEHFVWKDDDAPVRESGPLENNSAPGQPDPAAIETITRIVNDPQDATGALVLESIPAPAPEDLVTASWMRFTGLATHPDGRAFLCTPNGEVWQVRGLDSPDAAPRWRRFASGLDGPHRLAVTGGVVEARCRNGSFRLLDENNDGFCERYERKPDPKSYAESSRIERLSRYSDPARTGDNTWYYAYPHTENSPGTGLIRRDGNAPEDPESPIYVWLPGAESLPPAGPVWLPGASKWGGGLQSGTLMPCRDSGRIFRLWSAQPGDLSLPRVLWSLPIPPIETDIMGTAFSGSSVYFCGLPLDSETPAHIAGFRRVRRQKGHLFHPVEFAADDQSVTLRFNAPLDAAATAASRFVRMTSWQPDGAGSDAKPIAPKRVLLGRNTMRVVSDAIEPGGGVSVECAVTDGEKLSHRFIIHFTLPAELPPAVLPAPRPLQAPALMAGDAGHRPGIEDESPSPSSALLEDAPAFEWPGKLPQLDDPIEEEPLPER